LIPLTVAAAVLPARSTASRVTDWPAPVPVSVTSSGHAATSESASAQAKRTVTGPTYQPPSPRSPLTIEPVMSGGVLSSLTVTESLLRLPATSYASPVTTRPAVSSSTTTSGVVRASSTPDPPSLSLALKWTVTSSRFQACAFGPGVSVCVTIGAMLSYRNVAPLIGSVLPARSTA
jgi:hypothetical protein